MVFKLFYPLNPWVIFSGQKQQNLHCKLFSIQVRYNQQKWPLQGAQALSFRGVQREEKNTGQSSCDHCPSSTITEALTHEDTYSPSRDVLVPSVRMSLCSKLVTVWWAFLRVLSGKRSCWLTHSDGLACSFTRSTSHAGDGREAGLDSPGTLGTLASHQQNVTNLAPLDVGLM